jgi:two-component system, chemotaxis family, sensor kinase CheA
MLVFSDAGRSMGLVVDEIVDIVEDRLMIELQSDSPGTVGTAVIKGRATDIVDVGYYLPLAFDDWFKRPDKREHQIQRRLLFVDDSAFFRNMLTPVLKAAGYEVQAFASPAEALTAAKQAGKSYDVIVSDIEMPEMDGFAFAAACHADEALRSVPIIALSGTAPQASERHRAAGFRDTIAKFDRQGLIAALKDTMTGDAA